MRGVRLAAGACGGLGLVLAVVPLGAGAATQDVTVPVVQKTWTWTGPAQHPFAVQHPDLQYVADQNGAPSAQTLVRLGDVAGEVQSLTLTYPASASASDGAIDPYNNPSVPAAQQQGNVAVLTACPILSPWAEEPPGRPTEATLVVDCERAAAAGRSATVDGGPAWVFDLTLMAADWAEGAYPNQGVAIVPSHVAGGTWTVALQGAKAKAVAVVGSASDAGSDSGDVPVVTGGDTPPSEPALGGVDPGIPFTPPTGGTGFESTAPTPTTVAPSTTPTTGARPVLAASVRPRRVPPPVWVGLLLLALVLGLAGSDLWAGGADDLLDDEDLAL